MEKEAGARTSKNGNGPESSKPGTIVAGPDAHAREGAGKTPPGPGVKPADAQAKASTDGKAD